jgi:type IV secretory pathway protease TraF
MQAVEVLVGTAVLFPVNLQAAAHQRNRGYLFQPQHIPLLLALGVLASL